MLARTLLSRSARASFPSAAGRRSLATAADSSASSNASAGLLTEIGGASVLGLVLGGLWLAWARGQYARLDAFNGKLKQSKN